MSQGDLYKHRTSGEKGIEVRGNQTHAWVAVITPGWPYPAPPVLMARADLEIQPMRYLHGQTPSGTSP
jgi:hypothetical protein